MRKDENLNDNDNHYHLNCITYMVDIQYIFFKNFMTLLKNGVITPHHQTS